LDIYVYSLLNCSQYMSRLGINTSYHCQCVLLIYEIPSLQAALSLMSSFCADVPLTLSPQSSHSMGSPTRSFQTRQYL